MSRTVSPEQLAANRANAAKSTGPRTPEGKLRSSQNARKHGFIASSFAVVRLEDLQEVAHLREDLVTLYQPVNSQELFALERVQNRNFMLADGLHRLARQSNSFALLLRYQAQAERQYRRAIEEFERLKALRRELPNEPNSAETETNEPTCTPTETNPRPPENPAPALAPAQPPGLNLTNWIQLGYIGVNDRALRPNSDVRGFT
jgi:hypothetical protein